MKSLLSVLQSSELPGWRRAFNWMCGVNAAKETPQEDPDQDLTPEDKARRAAEFLEEKEPWKE